MSTISSGPGGGNPWTSTTGGKQEVHFTFDKANNKLIIEKRLHGVGYLRNLFNYGEKASIPLELRKGTRLTDEALNRLQQRFADEVCQVSFTTKEGLQHIDNAFRRALSRACEEQATPDSPTSSSSSSTSTTRAPSPPKSRGFGWFSGSSSLGSASMTSGPPPLRRSVPPKEIVESSTTSNTSYLGIQQLPAWLENEAKARMVKRFEISPEKVDSLFRIISPNSNYNRSEFPDDQPLASDFNDYYQVVSEMNEFAGILLEGERPYGDLAMRLNLWEKRLEELNSSIPPHDAEQLRKQRIYTQGKAAIDGMRTLIANLLNREAQAALSPIEESKAFKRPSYGEEVEAQYANDTTTAPGKKAYRIGQAYLTDGKDGQAKAISWLREAHKHGFASAAGALESLGVNPNESSVLSAPLATSTPTAETKSQSSSTTISVDDLYARYPGLKTDPEALYVLGRDLVKYPYDPTIDPLKGIELLREAARQGHKEAGDTLDELGKGSSQ